MLFKYGLEELINAVTLKKIVYQRKKRPLSAQIRGGTMGWRKSQIHPMCDFEKNRKQTFYFTLLFY